MFHTKAVSPQTTKEKLSRNYGRERAKVLEGTNIGTEN